MRPENVSVRFPVSWRLVEVDPNGTETGRQGDRGQSALLKGGLVWLLSGWRVVGAVAIAHLMPFPSRHRMSIDEE
jgi:hypothetical protein